MQASGEFIFTKWDEKPYFEAEGEPKLTRASVANKFTGGIEGESTLEYLMVYATEKFGSFAGYERVVGKVGERGGSFVLFQQGTFDDTGTITAKWSVVPGSGRGALSGLRGEGGFVAQHGDKATPYTLEYEVG